MRTVAKLGAVSVVTLQAMAAHAQQSAYIQNQSQASQAASFNISGDGIIAGRLGVGVAAPGQTLAVAGNGSFESAGRTRVLVDGNNGRLQFLRDDGVTGAGLLDTLGVLSLTSQGTGVPLQLKTTAGDIVFSPAGTERMRLLANGYVGIGTAAPLYPLDVVGTGNFSTGVRTTGITSTGQPGSVILQGNGQDITGVRDISGLARINFGGGNPLFVEQYNVHIALGNIGGSGNLSVGYNTAPAMTSALMVSGAYRGGNAAAFNGRVVVNGDLQVTGTKNFIHAHPGDASKVIAYVALEGGEAGTYWRGSTTLSKGRGRVELPGHFTMVTAEKGITVQASPGAGCAGWVAVTSKSNRFIELAERGGAGNCEVDFLVHGVRRGYENHAVMQPRPSSLIATAKR